MKIFIKNKSILISILLLSSCSNSDNIKIGEKSDTELYDKAKKLFSQKEYKQSASHFKEIDRRFPYSNLSAKGRLMSAYAYFAGKYYDDTIREIDIFMKFNETSQYAPYATYLKAESYFQRIRSVGRSQHFAIQAMATYEELIALYPDSIYVTDSKIKISVIKEVIASHELNIAVFYVNKGNYIAALKRCLFVIENMSETECAKDAYSKLIHCCIALEMRGEAKRFYKEALGRYGNGVKGEGITFDAEIIKYCIA